MEQRTQPRPRLQRRARCKNCSHKVALPAERFCSMRCAFIYVRELVATEDEGWCPQCRDWRSGDPYGAGCRVCPCGHDLVFPEPHLNEEEGAPCPV